MSENRPDKMPPADEVQFAQLVFRYLDEATTPEENEVLDTRLRTSDADRKVFIEICQQASLMTEVVSPPLAPASSTRTSEDQSDRSPILGFLGDAFQAGTDFLSRGLVVSVLLAIGLPGVLFLILVLHVARQPAPVVPVAKVTQTHKCVWDQSSTALSTGADLLAGEQLQLTEGLAEVTFADGAKVLLEGPAVFDATKRNGGFLQAGSLVANVPKRAVGFTVRTPQAVIVDLGTDFGVSVDQDGTTEAHVFTGRVEVAVRTEATETVQAPKELHVGQAARICPIGARKTARVEMIATAPKRFVQRIPGEMLDLVDVVCGGNGRGAKRGTAIDCTTGKIVPFDKDNVAFASDRRGYQSMAALPFVDGVFVPDAQHKGQAVQIDSTGGRFAGFPKVSRRGHVALLAGEKLAGVKGLESESLAMHAPQAITFDLATIRRANPGKKIDRFRAVAGIGAHQEAAGRGGTVDVWVLVDGKVRFARKNLSAQSPPSVIDIPLDENARFLTLASTDGVDRTRIVTADFSGGKSKTSVDAYPGKAGGGWASAWIQRHYHAKASNTVIRKNPLDGGGNYLRFTVKSIIDNDGMGAVSRDCTAGIDVTRPHKVDFKIRIDGKLDTFDSQHDQVYILDNARRSAATDPKMSWSISARGDVPTWHLYSRDKEGEEMPVDTGIPRVAGRVVHMSVDVDPVAKTWGVRIDDGVNPAFSADGLNFRTSRVGGFLHFGCRSDRNGVTHAFSFDSIKITQVPGDEAYRDFVIFGDPELELTERP